MFSDRLEVTVKQKPVEDIEAELGRLLERYMGEAIPVEAKEIPNEVLSPDEIDLDAELGLVDEPEPEPDRDTTDKA